MPVNTERIAAFLYDEVEAHLREFLGEPEAALPFSRSELLRFIRREALDNREDFTAYDMADDMAYSEALYLYGLRRVPEAEDLERMEKLHTHFEKQTRQKKPACGTAYRENAMQGIIYSEEARIKNLHILHNPYDRRNAVRRLEAEGKDERQ